MRDKNPPKTVIGFDAHYGMIGVESKLGKGSRFIIRLPMREVVEEPKEIYAQ